MSKNRIDDNNYYRLKKKKPKINSKSSINFFPHTPLCENRHKSVTSSKLNFPHVSNPKSVWEHEIVSLEYFLCGAGTCKRASIIEILMKCEFLKNFVWETPK